MALGTPEHSGRVIGGGYFVTPTTFFHTAKRGIHYRCEENYKHIQAQVSEMQAQMKANAQQTAQTPQSKHVSSNMLISESRGSPHLDLGPMENRAFISDNRGSPHLDPGPMENGLRTKHAMPPSNSQERKFRQSIQCQLAVGSVDNIFARGTLYEGDGPEEVLHTVALGESNVYVSVDLVIVQEARLPFPITGSGFIDNIVAHWTAYEAVGPEEVLHTVAIGESNVRVTVDKVILGEAILPIPIPGEALTVRQALGYHVAWPENLVLFGDKEVMTKGGAPKKCVVSHEANSKDKVHEKYLEHIRCFPFLVDQYPRDRATKTILENIVFGSGVEVFIQRANMESVCYMEPLTVTGLMLYMRYHWVLLVIDPLTLTVYYLDPLGCNEINENLRLVVETALKLNEALKQTSRRASITWKKIKSPRQPGSVECGFYVMRYMKELIQDPSILRNENVNGKQIHRSQT